MVREDEMKIGNWERDRATFELTRGASERRKTTLAVEAIKMTQPCAPSTAALITKDAAAGLVADVQKVADAHPEMDARQRENLVEAQIRLQRAAGLGIVPIKSTFDQRR